MSRTTEQVIPVAACKTYESLFDAVTRLPGWPVLIDRTTIALARASRSDRQVMVVVLDDVRAYRGSTPDLPAVVDSLRERLRPDDTVARVDERTLIAVCNDVGADSDAAQIARRLVAHAGVACNMGISLSGGHDDARSLLSVAVRDARSQTSAA